MEILGARNYDVAFTVGGTLVSIDGHNHDHDLLTNFVANEHIDHSNVIITAGTGLSGGGDLTANRTIDLDIDSLTADASPDGAADYVTTYDASAGAHKKVLLDNLPGGGGGLTYTEKFTLLADGNTSWATITVTGAAPNTWVEILGTNISSSIDKHIGIRAVGSGLERRNKVDKEQSILFWVKTNASSQVEGYMEQASSAQFWFTGEFA